jgi:Flp pilus assembly protein CpaB
MRFLTPARVMLAVVAMLGVFVMLGFFSVMKTLDALEQPKLTLQSEGFETRTIPLAVTTLKPGMVVRSDDIGKGPWPVREIHGDIILSERLIVGRVVQKEIESATAIHAASLKRLGEYSKEYVGVP